MAIQPANMTLQKNKREFVHVEPTVFHGRQLLNVRAYWYPDTGEPLATRKGLALSPELWRELLPIIQEVLERMEVGDSGETE